MNNYLITEVNKVMNEATYIVSLHSISHSTFIKELKSNINCRIPQVLVTFTVNQDSPLEA